MADGSQSSFKEKVPPQSLEAERAVIGAVLLDNAALSTAMEYLSEEAFYKRAHQDIFRGMENLFQKGEAIDIITLSEELKKSGRYQAVGGAVYLSEILEDIHTSANVEHYAKLVLDKYVLRRLISISGEVATQCYAAEQETEEILDDAEKRIFEITERGVRKGFIPIGKIIKQRFENIERLYETRQHVSGLPSAYDELDSYTSGFQNSDLVIIAGRPSMGKTSFALNIAQHLSIREKVPVGIFSLEMANEQLVMRLLCSEARVDSHRLRTGYLKSSEYAELAIVAGYLSEAPLYIDDTAGITTMEIRAKARRLKAEVNVGLIIIDYLQLIAVRERTENRQQQISIISRGLKALAKELEVPVIALSQLSRAVEARGGDKRPMLSDLRESGAIEQDADVVLFLYRPELYERDDAESKGIAELIIGKQRNGPTGTIKLAFIKEYTRFERLSPVSE